MSARQFGFPNTPAGRGQAARKAVGLDTFARVRYEPGVGLTILWHAWEYGRDGQRRPLPLVPPPEVTPWSA